MIEKRFTLDDEENGLCRCILVDGEEMPTCEICDLLNELSEENDILKQKLRKNYIANKQYEEMKRLQAENEALKKFIKDNFNEMMDSKMVVE